MINNSTRAARSCVSTLISAGIREVVLCPGSRNAPLSFALLAAEQAQLLRLHVRLDERSAAYMALGLAIGSGKPTVIVTTSGTAVANILPAVIEARYSSVPLIALSANRNIRYQNSGESQIITQQGIFHPFARYETQIDSSESTAQISAHVFDVIRYATELGGPVHLDFAFDEPLVPEDAWLPEEKNLPELPLLPQTETTTSHNPTPLDLSVDTLVIMGALPHSGEKLDPSVIDLINQVPTVAEPLNERTEMYCHPWILKVLKPKQLVIVGRPTLHREVSAVIKNHSIPTIAIGPADFFPGLPGDITHRADRLSLQGTPQKRWLQLCRSAHETAVEIFTDEAIFSQTNATGLTIAAQLRQATHNYRAIYLGASNAIRDFSFTIGAVEPQVKVFSNRGVSGIDGNIATAAGISLSLGATLAFMGDLTFLHDMGALLTGTHEHALPSLTIVVNNDNGGGIFNLLEQGEPRFSAENFGFERLFSTPQNVTISQLCAGLQVAYTLSEPHSLVEHIAQPVAGIKVVEVTTSRDSLRDTHHILTQQFLTRWANKHPVSEQVR